MFSRRSSRLLPCGAVVVLLTSCGADAPDTPDQPDAAEETSTEQESAGENPIPEPEYDGDDTVRLPLGFVTPGGQSQGAPLGQDGTLELQDTSGDPLVPGAAQPSPHTTEIARTEPFGCGDTISVIQSVPTVTDEPAAAAVEFLLTAESYTHGNPELINALSVPQNLELESVETDEDTVTVRLTGDAQVRSYCEGWQLAKQVETTARVATGATNAEIFVNDAPIAEVLGLEGDSPLEIIEINQGD